MYSSKNRQEYDSTQPIKNVTAKNVKKNSVKWKNNFVSKKPSIWFCFPQNEKNNREDISSIINLKRSYKFTWTGDYSTKHSPHRVQKRFVENCSNKNKNRHNDTRVSKIKYQYCLLLHVSFFFYLCSNPSCTMSPCRF